MRRRATTAALAVAALVLGTTGAAGATTVASIKVVDPSGDWFSLSANGETTAQKASIDLGTVSFARVRVDGRSYLRVVGHLRNVASYAGVAQSLRAVVMPTINGNTLIMTSDRGFGPELQKYTSSSGGYVDLACAGETQSYDNAADTITLRVPFSCVPSGFRTTVYGYATGTSYRNGKAGSDDDTDITAHQLDLG